MNEQCPACRTWREAADELVNRASVALLPVHELYGVSYRARAAFGERPADNRVLARKVYRAARLVHLWNKQTKTLFSRIEAAEKSERHSDRLKASSWFLSILMQDACSSVAPFMDSYVPASDHRQLQEDGSSADAVLLAELRALLKSAPATPTDVVDGIIVQRHRSHPGLSHGPGEETPIGGMDDPLASLSAIVPWAHDQPRGNSWDRIVSVGEGGTVMLRIPYSALYVNTSKAVELPGEHLRVSRLRAMWRCRTPLREVATAMEDLLSLQALQVAENQGYHDADATDELALEDGEDINAAAEGELFSPKEKSGDALSVPPDSNPGDPLPFVTSLAAAHENARPTLPAIAASNLQVGIAPLQQRILRTPDRAKLAADNVADVYGVVGDDEEEEEEEAGLSITPESGGNSRWDAGGAAAAVLSSLGLGGRRLFTDDNVGLHSALLNLPALPATAQHKRVRYPAALPRQHAVVAAGSLSLELSSITGTPLLIGCGLVAPLPSASLPRLVSGASSSTTGHAFMISMWIRTTATVIASDACPAVLCGNAINSGTPESFCQVLLSQRAADTSSTTQRVRAERGAVPLAGEMKKRSFRLFAEKGRLTLVHPFPGQPRGLSPQTHLVRRGWRVSTKDIFASGSWRHLAVIYNGALTATCDEDSKPPAVQLPVLPGLPAEECKLVRFTYAHKWSLFLDGLLEETAGQSGTIVAAEDLGDGGSLLPRYLTIAAGFGDTHDLQVDAVAVYGPGLFSQDDVAAARNAGLQRRRERLDAALCE
jgi:hypothetical protein